AGGFPRWPDRCGRVHGAAAGPSAGRGTTGSRHVPLIEAEGARTRSVLLGARQAGLQRVLFDLGIVGGRLSVAVGRCRLLLGRGVLLGVLTRVLVARGCLAG